MKTIIKNYILFILGLFIAALGVAMSVKAELGTSPVSAVPYSVSLINLNFSFGTWLILWSFLQIFIQIILLRRECKASNIVIQLILAFMYGYMTDFACMLLKGIVVNNYIQKFILMIGGCFVVAFGIWLQLRGKVSMLSGEAMNYAISYRFNKSYEFIKVMFDVLYIIVAALICIFFTGKLQGVREGSIIAALLVGSIIKLYGYIFNLFFRRR